MEIVDNTSHNQPNKNKPTAVLQTHTAVSARMRRISFLPHLFTMGNAFFGFCSIIFAASGELIAAAYFILMGALMDLLDGRIARYTNTASALGVQLDSLSDAISFCLAPAFLVYMWQLKNLHGLGLVACGIFLVTGLFRLARFNLTHAQQNIAFMGIPTTFAGCFLVSIFLNMSHMHPQMPFIVFLFLLVLMLSFLMVSNIPFPTFKQINKHILAPILVGLAAVSMTMGFTKVLLFIFIGYFLISFEEAIRKSIRKNS